MAAAEPPEALARVVLPHRAGRPVRRFPRRFRAAPAVTQRRPSPTDAAAAEPPFGVAALKGWSVLRRRGGEWLSVCDSVCMHHYEFMSHDVDPRFHCGHCDRDVVAMRYVVHPGNVEVVLCPGCLVVTNYVFVSDGLVARRTQIPTPRYGRPVEHLPASVDRLYRELRTCISGGAFTGAALVGRTLLMHLAVAEGSKESTFQQHVQYIDEEKLAGRRAKVWIDRVRSLGNIANHEIVDISEDDARAVCDLVELLLRNLYEAPARARVPDP